MSEPFKKMTRHHLNYSGATDNNEIPMFFIFSYFGNIISECLNMPTIRYETVTHPPALEYSTWVTPSELGAAVGMITYIIIFLTLAYILYQRRQSKSE